MLIEVSCDLLKGLEDTDWLCPMARGSGGTGGFPISGRISGRISMSGCEQRLGLQFEAGCSWGPEQD